MKAIALLFTWAVLFALPAAPAYGATGISVDSVVGLQAGDTVASGTPVIWHCGVSA